MKELDLLLKNIKNKVYQPIYFFHGDEPYYINKAVDALEENVLTEEEKAFGLNVIYGKETDILSVLGLARQIPMMGDYQLIIVKEAQDLRFGEAEREALFTYINNPSPTTILVFAHLYKKVDGKTKFASALKKSGGLFLSEKIKDYQLVGWISDKLKKMQVKAESNVANLLEESLGNDLLRIENEIEKLKMMLLPGETLTSSHIELHIGISREFNVFGLVEAIEGRREEEAMRIAHFLSKGKDKDILTSVIGNLTTKFINFIFFHSMSGQSQEEMAKVMQVNPKAIYFVAPNARNYPLKIATRALSIVREFDAKNKGIGVNGNTDKEDLLKEMVYKILHVHELEIKV